MHKRALLLTAATFAILSGQAFADTTPSCTGNTDDLTDITKSVTGPICTSTAKSGKAGDILIDVNGTVTNAVVSGATPTIIPVVTIDSNNLVTNNGRIAFVGTNNAIGIQLDTGNTGGLDMQTGVLDMRQGGTDKIGILVTDATSGKFGTFTGVKMPDAVTPLKKPTAIDLESGSTVEIQGDGSSGIEIETGDRIAGNIDIGGTIVMTPTTNNEATNSGTASIGVNLLGKLQGDFIVNDGGTIDVTGPGANGVVVDSRLFGEFNNDGSIEVTGSATVNPDKTTNPLSGSAVIVAADVGGGILNDGPTNTAGVNADGTAVGDGSIAASGAPALIISASTKDVDIGGVADSTNKDKITKTGYSLLNRGSISSTAPNPQVDTTAILLSGTAGSAKVEFTGGIFNSGSISASSTTKTPTGTSTTGTPTAARAIDLEDFVKVPDLVNSFQAGLGNIAATVSGNTSGTAEAIFIDSTGTGSGSGSLKSIENDQGATISAEAVTSDSTVTQLVAVAIDDMSGSLRTIINDGTISATATTLDSNDQITEAINAQANTTGVDIKDGGTIIGDLILGSGADTLRIGDALSDNTTPASVTGNVFFGGDVGAKGDALDSLSIHAFGSFAGQIEEPLNNFINVHVYQGGSLTLENNGTTFDGIESSGTCFRQAQACGLQTNNFFVDAGSTLTVDVAQVFNQQGSTINPAAVISANRAVIEQGTDFSIGFGSFLTAVGGPNSQFVLVGTPTKTVTVKGNNERALQLGGPSGFKALQDDISDEIPFLFTGGLCTVDVHGGHECATTPKGVTGSALVLNLDPKKPVANCTPTQRNGSTFCLDRFANTMFKYANQALANDTQLGAAVISAGLPVNGQKLSNGAGNALYQGIYSSFAPDVTGSARAIAISLTDSATGVVAARQRELRMYAGQESDATLWGQEFTQTLNVGTNTQAGGYNDSGFGFALGADSGDPRNGRYGVAFQFYSGDTHEKSPRIDNTDSEWLVLTGYTDWRGKGFFFDSQASVGFAQLKGNRFIDIGQAGSAICAASQSVNCTVKRDARGDRDGEFLSGSATTGVTLAAGGTVFTPQLSLDGLTMREEGYTETSSTAQDVITAADDGFDLTVKPNYMNSLRLFAGADVRQDLNLGGFYLQPDARVGYRYDFLGAAEKVKAAFVSEESNPANFFSISGPDPARSNLVLGGGLATTTGAWSVGVSYDYVKGVGGTNSLNQVGTFTLVGKL